MACLAKMGGAVSHSCTTLYISLAIRDRHEQAVEGCVNEATSLPRGSGLPCAARIAFWNSRCSARHFDGGFTSALAASISHGR